jgi:hypothetical protein
MALKAILDSLDGLSEELRGHYTEQDGKFMLSVTSVDGFALENTKGLKSALERERADRRKLNDRLAAIGDHDPDVIREAVSKLDEIKSWDPDKKVSEAVKAREAQIVDLHKKELNKADGRAKTLQRQLESVLIDQAAERAIVEAKGNVRLLLPHVKSALRIREDGERFLAEVVNERGEPRIGDKHGQPMTIAQYVEELRTDASFAAAFTATDSRGSGASGGSGSRGTTSAGQRIATRDDLAHGRVDPQELIDGKVALQ